MDKKAYVFVSSSTEQLETAYDVQDRLQFLSHVTVWTQGVFEPSKNVLDSLLKELRRCDIGIFIFNPDDILKIRDKTIQATRDNVLFELGLFIGHLGRDRCFMILPKDKEIYLPSDLVGFTPVFYDVTHPNRSAAIGGACLKIEKAIKNLGKKSLVLGNLERKINEVSNKTEANLSTGAAINYIGENIIKAILDKDILGIDDLVIFSQKLAESIRGQMVEFRHFIKVGKEYPLSQWSQKVEYLADYTKKYIQYSERCNKEIGKAFGKLLIGKTNICLTEYSRAVLSGINFRLKTGEPLNIYLVDRASKANVPEEVKEIEKILIQNGAQIVKRMNLEQWMQFIDSIIKGEITDIDFIVFGSEALTHNGDNVFPQIISANEQEQLLKLRKIVSRNTKTICVAESYKVVTSEVYEYVSSLPYKGNYTLIPNEIYDLIITECKNIEGFKRKGLIECLEKSVETSRQICLDLFQNERLIPFDYSSNKQMKNIKVVAADIDETITNGGKIYPEILKSFIRLQESGISVVLITGRSSGWCQALISYLPGIDYILAENGIVLIDKEGNLFFLDNGEEESVKNVSKILKDKYGLLNTPDNMFRLKDQTFIKPDNFTEKLLKDLNNETPESIEVITSSIHIHVRKKGSNKGKSLAKVNSEKFRVSEDQILVIGDSPNDKSLFENFKISVGVANVLGYIDELGGIKPKYITKMPEGKGFLEVVERLTFNSN